MSKLKSQMSKLLIICGPTATGKTKLALTLASMFGGELVSADSRQVYKDVDALTGKDRPVHGDVPIWMYDVVNLNEEFSVALYQDLAKKVIDDIESRGKLPIIVGGTGLYLKALTQPLVQIHIPPNTKLRKKLRSAPCEVLEEELKKIDQQRWSLMNESDKKNPRRLIRAIEIAQWQGNHHELKEESEILDTLWIGLATRLPILEDRIRKRIMIRWEDATSEVQKLKGPPSVSILGISAIQQFLHGERSKEDTVETWVREERKYAKRQMTWFKKQTGIHWFDMTKETYIQDVIALAHSWYTSYT